MLIENIKENTSNNNDVIFFIYVIKICVNNFVFKPAKLTKFMPPTKCKQHLLPTYQLLDLKRKKHNLKPPNQNF
jgi:hypothetical protein